MYKCLWACLALYHHGANRANTMGLFSDLSHEAEWRSKGMSGSKQLEQGHHQRAPQAHDGGGDST